MPDHSGGTLVTCIAITSGIGRIIFGKVADHPNVNGIALQQGPILQHPISAENVSD
jgi:hypothetical protein